MKARTFILLIVFAIIAGFALLNWQAIMMLTPINIGFMTVSAPIGLILLGFIALLTVVFLTYLLYMQTTTLLESRRLNKELDAQRAVAEQAEKSRFIELQTTLSQELQKIGAKQLETQQQTLQYIDKVHDAMISIHDVVSTK